MSLLQGTSDDVMNYIMVLKTICDIPALPNFVLIDLQTMEIRRAWNSPPYLVDFKTLCHLALRKLFLARKYFSFQENFSYSETVFVNQDKVPHRKDRKFFLS